MLRKDFSQEASESIAKRQKENRPREDLEGRVWRKNGTGTGKSK